MSKEQIGVILAKMADPGMARCDQWVERGGGVRTACGKPAIYVDVSHHKQKGRDPIYYCEEHVPGGGEPDA